ncbi:MAG TPA: GH3 auxin-responsive promoter family protein, partial [Phycisphaerae bacterium]|nr:GH3 auxin-responsive promoter family protein [Phycisphaerae bacterium]
PDLTLFVHGGVFFEPYRPIFDQYFAGLNVDYLDIYSASEASIAIQTDPCDPSLLLALDHNVFYEFVPLEEWGRPDAPRLTVADVQTGVSYVILLTTCAGLWSYDLGDIVRFTNLRPLKLLITGRHKLFISAFGENIISEHVEAAVAHACRLTGARVHEFTAAPRFPDARRPLPAHEYVIEFASPPADMDAFRHAIDSRLCEQSLDYAIKRRGDLAMSCVEVTPVPEGTFYEWLKRRGRLGGQHKVPRCANHREYVDALRAIVDGVQDAPG